MQDSEQYFADMESEELGEHLSSKFKEWRETMTSNGIENRWAKSYRFYYGMQVNRGTSYTFNDSDLHRVGDNGELVAYSTNHYRNFIRHTMALTTAQKPTFDCKANNTDLETIQKTKVGNNVVEYYMEAKKMSRNAKRAAELCLMMARAFVLMEWDTAKGRPVDSEKAKDADGKVIQDYDGKPVEKLIYEGDVKAKTVTALDVRTDVSLDDWQDCTWWDVRDFQNKWDVASKYPKKRDEILEQSAFDEHGRLSQSSLQWIAEDSDMIPIFKFYHLPTPAMPAGRYQIRLSDGTVLSDGPYPFGDKKNLMRIVPGELYGSILGYTDFYDILPLQEAYNLLSSTALSNQSAYGVQAVAVSQQSSITSEETGGMTFIKVPSPVAENMPKAVQLCATPPEIFTNRQQIEGSMEKLIGINAATRGEPQENLKSGVALARVQAMAIQFTSQFQESWAELLEDMSEFTIHLLKLNAKSERLISISGKRHAGAVKSFTSDDLQSIDTVSVDLGNPLSRTVAGKIEIAERLIDKGMIKTPQEYINVLSTGNLEPLTEGPEAELALIRKENEMLMDGQGTDALVGDAHLLHMQEHKTLLANPEIRNNGEQVSVILAHIQHHMELYKTQDPVWAAVSGEPPAPKPPPAPGPGGSGPVPPGLGGAGPEMTQPPEPEGVGPAIPPPAMPQG